MNIYVLEPIGNKSYLLFDTMVDTFREHGHEFVECHKQADVIFFDLWTGLGEYVNHAANNIIHSGKPIVGFDFFDQWGSPQHRPRWWGFDDCAILKEKAALGRQWAEWLSRFLDAGSIRLMFMRKMSKSWEYPEWVKPIECVMYPGHDFEPTSKYELASREQDVCFVGNATPWRSNAVGSLLEGGISMNYFFPYHRLEHDEWLERHRTSKMFLEADGGGFGSERPYQLATIAPMLRVKNDQRMAFPWTNEVNCIEVGSEWGRVSTEECRYLEERLMDMDWLHKVYIGGIAHLHAHYTPEARSLYILEQMKEAGIA